MAGRSQIFDLKLRHELVDTLVEVLNDVEDDNPKAYEYYICPYHPSQPNKPLPTDDWPLLVVKDDADLLIIYFVDVMKHCFGKVSSSSLIKSWCAQK